MGRSVTKKHNPAYFQQQSSRSRDCTLCSFNNAMGYTALTKRQVDAFINKVVDVKLEKAYKKKNGRNASIPTTHKTAARALLSDHSTFYSPDAVWGAAIEKGLIRGVAPIGKKYASVASMARTTTAGIIILGADPSGANHAVAVRGGMLFDSQQSSAIPEPLRAHTLKTMLDKIHIAYVLVM